MNSLQIHNCKEVMEPSRVGTFEVIFTLVYLFTLYVNKFYRKKYSRQKSGEVLRQTLTCIRWRTLLLRVYTIIMKSTYWCVSYTHTLPYCYTQWEEEFEDTKGVIRIRKSKQTTQWPKEKVQKDKQRFRVTRPLVLCVWFVDRCLSFCTFSFGHCVVCFDLRILITPLVSSNSSSHWV
jgi:hypothetical protein